MPVPKKRPVRTRRKATLADRALDEFMVLLDVAPLQVPAIRKRSAALGLPKASLRSGCDWMIDLEVVGDAEMARLNGIYRNKPKTTDVLSFPASGIFQKQGVIGSIVLGSAQLRRQAKALGHSELDELRVLLVHGFCHLLDWDHERGPEEAREMARVERSVLEACFPASAKRVRGLIDRSAGDQISGVSQRARKHSRPR